MIKLKFRSIASGFMLSLVSRAKAGKNSSANTFALLPALPSVVEACGLNITVTSQKSHAYRLPLSESVSREWINSHIQLEMCQALNNAR